MEVGFFTASLDRLAAWAQNASNVGMPLSLGCCPCEFGVVQSGMPVCFNPRRSDVLIVAGAVGWKAAPVIRRIYDMMPAPKSVVGVGLCALNGGLFADSYAAAAKLSDIVPVDCWVKGCPPTVADFAAAIAELKHRGV